jgi:SAM-dependent methyltransferase
MNNCNYSGRLKVVAKLVDSKNKFSLSVGAKETRFATINSDIDPSVNPDMVIDVRELSHYFKPETFDLVYFTDVIEHIPKKDEKKALKEIYKVLKKDGILIFSTPNDRFLFTFLDPAFWVIHHRHYKIEEIKKLLQECGFQITSIFTSGGVWACIGNLWYCLITYPLKKILNRKLKYAPHFIEEKIDAEYDYKRTTDGYTIFCLARK